MKRARTSSKAFQGVKNGPFVFLLRHFRGYYVLSTNRVLKKLSSFRSSHMGFKWEAYCWYSCYGSQYSMQSQKLEMFIVPWWTL